MPKLFKLNEEKLFEKVEIKKFKNEKEELRDLFRKNMENGLFPNLTFLDVEYYISSKKVSIQRKREGKQKKERNFVDTIAYYDKEKTFEFSFKTSKNLFFWD